MKGRVFDKVCILYIQICAQFSKRLRKVSLNKRMLKCKTFIPTLSKLNRTCRSVLLWPHAAQTYLSTQTLIRSSWCFLFTVIARPSLVVLAYIFFSMSWPVQTKPSTRMFSFHRRSPHKITYPCKQAFVFLYCSLHRQTRPQGHLLFTDISHLLPTKMFSSLWHGLHRSICPYGHFFPLTQPTHAFLSTQTLSNFCCGVHKPICPHDHFCMANWSIRTFSFH